MVRLFQMLETRIRPMLSVLDAFHAYAELGEETSHRPRAIFSNILQRGAVRRQDAIATSNAAKCHGFAWLSTSIKRLASNVLKRNEHYC